MSNHHRTITIAIAILLSIGGCFAVQREVAKKEGEISILLQDNQQKGKRIDTLSKALAKANSIILEQKKTINKLNQAVSGLRDSVNYFKNSIHKLKGELRNVKQEKEKIKLALANHLKHTDQQIIDFTNKINDLEEEKKAKEKKIQDLEHALIDKNQAIAQQTAIRDSLERANNEMAKQNGKLTVAYQSFLDIVENIDMRILDGQLSTGENGRLISNIKDDKCKRSVFTNQLTNIDTRSLVGQTFLVELFDITNNEVVANQLIELNNPDGYMSIDLRHNRLKSAHYKLRLHFVPDPNSPGKNEYCRHADERVVINNKVQITRVNERP